MEKDCATLVAAALPLSLSRWGEPLLGDFGPTIDSVPADLQRLWLVAAHAPHAFLPPRPLDA